MRRAPAPAERKTAELIDESIAGGVDAALASSETLKKYIDTKSLKKISGASVCGHALNEGITEYFTEANFSEQKLGSGRAYRAELKLMTAFVPSVGEEAAAKAYSHGDRSAQSTSLSALNKAGSYSKWRAAVMSDKEANGVQAAQLLTAAMGRKAAPIPAPTLFVRLKRLAKCQSLDECAPVDGHAAQLQIGHRTRVIAPSRTALLLKCVHASAFVENEGVCAALCHGLLRAR